MKPKIDTGLRVCCAVLAVLAVLPAAAQEVRGDVLGLMDAANDDLKAMWMDIRLESIEYFTVGQGRPASRLHGLPYRWVEGDERRGARAGGLTWTLDGTWGEATASGVPAAAAAAAIRRATATWAADSCLRDGALVERQAPPGDVTVTDFLLGVGGFGELFFADVVHAGWLPGEPPLFASDVLAFAATYVFVDRDSGAPTDVDGDGHLDVALTEIFYNDDFRWSTGAAGAGFDVETAALHEIGHALGLGHFGPPPAAVMNPAYAGSRRQPAAVDHAGLCTIWLGR